MNSDRGMRDLATAPAVLALALFAGCATEQPMNPDGSNPLMYVGTYTRETSAGIYAYRFDPSTGAAQPLGLVAEMPNPSFLALHPNGKYLYAVSETDDYDDDGSGSVVSFAIDAATGALEELNEVSSRGGWPCHLGIDPSGRMLIVANYKGGSVAAFPVRGDGSLGEASSFFQHEGGSLHARQQQPHAHSSDFSAGGRFAFFSDLGLDQIKVYRADPDAATLEPHDPPYVEVPPGSGPRHFAQHPSGQLAYGLNELSSTVSAFRLDGDEGELSLFQTVSTLPDGFEGENYTAEIHVHPSGEFVYASNRGHHSIAIFLVDPATGGLQPRGRTPTRGEWPRNFAFDPSGRFLLAANQNSDNIAVFTIETSSGALTPAQRDISIDAPVCIVFRAAAEG